MFTGGFDASAIPSTDVVALGAEDVPGVRSNWLQCRLNRLTRSSPRNCAQRAVCYTWHLSRARLRAVLRCLRWERNCFDDDPLTYVSVNE